MVRRHELTDAQWKRIEPLPPGNGTPGGQWAEHRKVVSGVLYRARAGVPWRDLPERFGPWQTVYERHRRWSADGTWAAILAELTRSPGATPRHPAVTVGIARPPLRPARTLREGITAARGRSAPLGDTPLE